MPVHSSQSQRVLNSFKNIFEVNFYSNLEDCESELRLTDTGGYFVCVGMKAVLSACLLTHVNEVARGFGLARHIGLEISVHAVLHFAVEGLIQ